MTKLIALFLGMLIIGVGDVSLAQTWPHYPAIPRAEVGVAVPATVAVFMEEGIFHESGWPEYRGDAPLTSGLPVMKLPDWKDALRQQLIDWHIRRAA